MMMVKRSCLEVISKRTVAQKHRIATMSTTILSQPHFLKETELTPGIARTEFEARRRALVEKIPADSICIIPGYGLRYMTSNIFYPFHQNTNVLYLSGFNEADSALVFEKSSKFDKGFQFTMFVQPSSKALEMWDGRRTGIDGAKEIYGADESRPINDLPNFLESLAASKSSLITDLGLSLQRSAVNLLETTHIKTLSGHATHQPSQQFNLPKLLQEFHGSSKSTLSFWKNRSPVIETASSYLHSMRLIKSEAEIRVMRESGRISGRAFSHAMAQTKPGMGEHQIHAILSYHMMMQGSTCLAYVPVVASGRNALTLHYVSNSQLLRDGDLVLVDAGGEYGHYASDITRTWPVNGKFSNGQRRLYEAVLRVQKAMIGRCVEEHSVSLNDLQEETCLLLKDELNKLFERRLSDSEFFSLYPHHVGHYIGLDLHDTETVSRSIRLKRGMTITIEPGLYVPDSPEYPPEFRGIGIRIEDDIVVGSKASGGPIVLTSEAPKEVDDIEALMAGLITPTRY